MPIVNVKACIILALCFQSELIVIIKLSLRKVVTCILKSLIVTLREYVFLGLIGLSLEGS